jgi:hypothetical protein
MTLPLFLQWLINPHSPRNSFVAAYVLAISLAIYLGALEALAAKNNFLGGFS